MCPLAHMYFAEGAPEPMTLSFLYYAWFRGHLLMPSSAPEVSPRTIERLARVADAVLLNSILYFLSFNTGNMRLA